MEIWNLNPDTILDKNSEEKQDRMWLMYRDLELLEFTNRNIIYINPDNKDFLPLSLKDEDISMSDLEIFLKNRSFSIDRKYYKRIMNVLGAKYSLPLGIIYFTNGLSLTDSYWIKIPRDKDKTWKDVNLFENSFNKVMSMVAFTGKSPEFAIQNKFNIPEINTAGSYAKCWRREGKDIYLYKADNGNNEVLKEVFASKVIQSMKTRIGCVNYEKVILEGIIASKCKLISSDKLNIVPASEVYTYYNNHCVNYYELLKSDYKEIYEELLFVHAIINNSDLHLGNYGFYYNGQRMLNLHEAFDFNNSLEEDEAYTIYYGKQVLNINLIKLLLKTDNKYKQYIERLITMLKSEKDNNYKQYKEYMIERINKIIKE